MTAVPRRGSPVVAVVDDSEDHRALARRMLEPAYQVRTYADGPGALADFSAGAIPDLVLLDIRMPWLSGREVLARVRGDAYLAARFAGVPVIAFSSAAAVADLTAYRAAGFDGWIGKALDHPAELRARVAAYLEQSGAAAVAPAAPDVPVADAEPVAPMTGAAVLGPAVVRAPAPDVPASAADTPGDLPHRSAAGPAGLAVATHDLLSALGAVQASLRLLRRQLPPICERELDLLDIADRNADRAIRIVRDLRDV